MPSKEVTQEMTASEKEHKMQDFIGTAFMVASCAVSGLLTKRVKASARMKGHPEQEKECLPLGDQWPGTTQEGEDGTVRPVWKASFPKGGPTGGRSPQISERTLAARV